MQLHSNARTLNIKDQNINFHENNPSEEFINGSRSLIYDGTLSYKPTHCPNCGVVNKSTIESKGYAHKLSLIKVPKVSELNAYLRLKKQRHYCRECQTSFTCQSPVVDGNSFIGNNLKYAIAVCAMNKMSEKDIAKRYNVSHSTVGRVIDSSYRPKKLYKHYLPEVLGVDEFKSVKHAKGAMSFIFADLIKHEIVDIVEDRRLNSLINYFSYYTHKARKMVKYVVMDMYSPYIELVKKMFPNAKIVIDRFHLVQLMGRSMQQTRIKIMKTFGKKTKEYNLLKKNFKLLGKNREEVNDTIHRKWRRNDKMMTARQVVDDMISVDEELKQAYEVYQAFMLALKLNDFKQIETILHRKDEIKSEYIKKSLNTLTTYLPYLKNTLKTNYTNGFVEGFNNLIKVIKRVSFGYRSFIRFRNRIMIISGFVKKFV